MYSKSPLCIVSKSLYKSTVIIFVGVLLLLAYHSPYKLLIAGRSAGGIFDYEALDADGIVVPLSRYQSAKVIIVVNTASNCGYTYVNFQQLRQLYEKYQKDGLEILAFPCNQFGNQEPGDNYQVQEFVRNYGISFPVFAKTEVNGPQANPLFQYLKSSTGKTELQWNFVKFLIVNGEVVQRYAPRDKPMSFEADIRMYLGLEGSGAGDDDDDERVTFDTTDEEL